MHVDGATPVSEQRNIKLASTPNGTMGFGGRNVIVVIGIDRYHHWRRLANAVGDANGAAALFQQLGFEQVTAPLLDDRATGKAIQSLVTDDLRTLGPDDSLVLFYAGHGGTQKHRIGDQVIKTGYLIPVDAQDKVATWIDLEGWLRAVSLLPAMHILVVLDACHSGIALDPIIKWRNTNSWQDVPLSTLKTRRSRRIITSALDDQFALDSGPVYGHSLFTGCLIEGLTHSVRRGSSRVTTGSELGLYVQRRVETYPSSRQTPDFGTFAFDDRGEMVIPLMSSPTPQDDKSEVAFAEPVLTPTELFAAVSPALIPPPPPEIVALIAPTPEPTVENVPRERDRRWGYLRRVCWIAGSSAAFVAVASVLVGGRVFHDKPSPVASPVHAPAGAAADSPPNAKPRFEGLQPTRPLRRNCPDGMVLVPAGTFQMGSPASVVHPNEHPRHEVTLSAYCIDKTEVTVEAYAACVEAKTCLLAPLTPLTVDGGAISPDQGLLNRFCNGHDRPNHPINCVDWEQAMAYCTWAGKRLPTEAEWEYAARGNDGRIYPWGNEAPTAKRLNACGSECVAMAKRDLGDDWGAMYIASDGWETTAPVGSFPDGASPFGALDMAGNVFEWTADWDGAYAAAAAVNPRGANTGPGRVDRGGSWNLNNVDHSRTAFRAWVSPSDRVIDVGFRCARVE
jgi:formylglycine-generating enzyme required for sulfatase activity